MDGKTLLLIVLSVIIILLIVDIYYYTYEVKRVNDGVFGIHESLLPLLDKPVTKLILIRRTLMTTPWLKSFWAKHSALICVTDEENILLDINANNSIQLYSILPLENDCWVNEKEYRTYTETGTYIIKEPVTVLDIITMGRQMHQNKKKPFCWLNNNCHHETAEIIRSFCVCDENDPVLNPPAGMKLIGNILINRT